MSSSTFNTVIGKRDTASPSLSDEEGKRHKLFRHFNVPWFNLLPFIFSTFGSLGVIALEMLLHICRRYNLHKQVSEWEAQLLHFEGLMSIFFARQFVE